MASSLDRLEHGQLSENFNEQKLIRLQEVEEAMRQFKKMFEA